ncbi:MAG: hypothetical protein LBG61_01350, partial [Burkholderiales bacterium]|nr:hypothetical protein [Burkholderiales bacterium]
NKYIYANSDPINAYDPSGYFSLGGMMSGMNTMVNIASVSYDIYTMILGNPNDEKPDGPFRLWDALMAMGMKSLVGSCSSDIPTLGIVNAGFGKPEKHHTIPVYLCGAERQKLALISYSTHKKLHSEMYAYKTVSDVLGYAVDTLVFKKKVKGVLTPTMRLARTRQGRAAIAGLLYTFYSSNGWFGEGGSANAILNVFPAEAAKFTAGNHSFPRCKKI